MSDTYDGAEQLIGSLQAELVPTATRPRSRVDQAEGGVTVTLQGGLPLTMCDGRPMIPAMTPARRMQGVLKRLLLDIPLAGMALLVLSPMLLTIAVLIRLGSKGPALFSQERVGLKCKPFRMVKFRTMREDSCDSTGLAQVVANDDRVTPIGRFLRATSIDELPQLWNILVGDMSIIGPRPMVEGMQAAGVDYREAVPYYDFRHLVKPGLSGWAQANGLRGPTTDMASARERIDHDCAYVQNFSLLLDIKIIARTILREFLTGSGV